MLQGKTIIIGVTGGIAAYKACDLVSKLKQQGADVWVVMTDSAAKFVSPLTFRTLSQNPVIQDLFSDEIASLPVPHISLTQKADLIAVVPATANILAKTVHGIADDALSTIILSAKCPKLFAPAMNTAMWNNPAVKENLQKMISLGLKIINPDCGYLACGDTGEGKLAGVADVINEITELLVPSQDLKGKHFLITAGGTREAIDPVRFIGNRSSGKMGFAMAEAAVSRGAKVTLIAGHTNINPPAGVELIRLDTAKEMQNAVNKHLSGSDVVVMTAAVADYAPAESRSSKIKKNAQTLKLDLNRTPDILEAISAKRKKNQVIVGFAAETDDLIKNAKQKLKQKNLDLIVANDVSRKDAGFESDTNQVHIINRNGESQLTACLPKKEIAHQILDQVSSILCMQK